MRVCVVGAGISGLTAAWRLARRGHHVEVLEAAARVGGRMRSVVREGLPVDVGVHLLLDSYVRTRALSAEVGLGDAWFEPVSGAGGVLRDEELTSFAPRDLFELLRYRGVSWPARLRVAAFALRTLSLPDTLDFFDLSVGPDDHDALDADTWCRAHLGDEVTDWLVDPFVRTFHFHAASALSLKAFDALARLLLCQGDLGIRVLRGHMQALPQALADRLDVTCDVAVRAVRPSGDGVEVEADGVRRRYDRVVLAVPPPVALQLLGEDGPTSHLAVLGPMRCSSTMMVAAAVPLAVARDFHGIWVPFKESWVLSGCANEHAKGGHDDEFTVFSFGLQPEAAHALADATDRAVHEVVALEWARLFPAYAGRLLPLNVQRWTRALPIYAPGSIGPVRRWWEVGQGEGGVLLCGDHLNHPWVEGSVRCGEKVAAAVG